MSEQLVLCVLKQTNKQNTWRIKKALKWASFLSQPQIKAKALPSLFLSLNFSLFHPDYI